VEEWNSRGGEEQRGKVKEARNSLGSEKLSRKRGTVNEAGAFKRNEEQSRKQGIV
jgi:hypothetical protein